MYIFLLNGPAGSGKDSIADAYIAMTKTYTSKRKFAALLKHKVHETVGIKMTPEEAESVKDAPHAVLGGATLRQAYIAYSEGFIKPVYGSGHFGKELGKLLRPLQELDIDIIITDSGFYEEAEALLKELPLAKGVYQVIIERPHKRFARNIITASLYNAWDKMLGRDNITRVDSRSYWFSDNIPVCGVIHNNGTIAEAASWLLEIITEAKARRAHKEAQKGLNQRKLNKEKI